MPSLASAPQADLPAPASDAHGALAALFAEELGLVMEVAAGQEEAVVQAYRSAGVACSVIGSTLAAAHVSIAVGGQPEITGGCWYGS